MFCVELDHFIAQIKQEVNRIQNNEVRRAY
jgi:hypothetical protein